MNVGFLEAKAKFPKLVELAEQGQESVISRNGKAVARLVPIARRSAPNPNAAVIDRIERFSRTIKLRRRIDLPVLIEGGRF